MIISRLDSKLITAILCRQRQYNMNEGMRQKQSLLLLAFAAGISDSSVPIAVVAVPIILSVLALRTWISLLDPEALIPALPVILPILALGTGVALLDPEVFVEALPVILPILAQLAGVALGDVSVAVQTPPVVLPILALAGIALGVIEVTVVAAPGVLPVAALAGVPFLGVPPIGGIHACSAPLHAVSGGVADVAGGTGPVVLPVLAFVAGVALLGVLLAVLAVPGHQQDMLISRQRLERICMDASIIHPNKSLSVFQALGEKRIRLKYFTILRSQSNIVSARQGRWLLVYSLICFQAEAAHLFFSIGKKEMIVYVDAIQVPSTYNILAVISMRLILVLTALLALTRTTNSLSLRNVPIPSSRTMISGSARTTSWPRWTLISKVLHFLCSPESLRLQTRYLLTYQAGCPPQIIQKKRAHSRQPSTTPPTTTVCECLSESTVFPV